MSVPKQRMREKKEKKPSCALEAKGEKGGGRREKKGGRAGKKEGGARLSEKRKKKEGRGASGRGEGGATILYSLPFVLILCREKGEKKEGREGG